MELIPAVVQHHATGQVLMVAYMNDEALRLTRDTGFVHFWSRSRKRLWKKGEQSGNTLRLVELRLDCDNDCLLVRAEPAGAVCHTGHATCFFTDGDGGAPASMLDAVYRIIQDRKRDPPATESYTRKLLDAGPVKIIGKIVEECGELCAELGDGSREAIVHECADLLYHVLVGLGARDVEPAAVLVELARRFGTSGLTEKKRRVQRVAKAHPRGKKKK
ncbi:MAG TPA: bifunctional phosphoribosyl-AMP cyclohydrolase/phosphoribosyl-ATP diphosphatase HisIE [Polyangia bacterium]|nr:bifunctional phosphoribosyl-AMP cyclohydrolase/phosphoribosyl-ATP diphosphatase HisIE [Polyangia bacterium]